MADTTPSLLERVHKELTSITLGQLIKFGVPTVGVLALVWFLAEPVIAGQIEGVFSKYGVDKKSFSQMQTKVEQIPQIQSDLDELKKNQNNQNNQIIYQLRRLNGENPPPPVDE